MTKVRAGAPDCYLSPVSEVASAAEPDPAEEVESSDG